MGLRVAFLAAECEPWAKTGGLADVVDALARALGDHAIEGVDGPVDVFLPRYRGVPEPDASAILGETVLAVPDPQARTGSSQVTIVDVAANGYRLRLVDHPPAFDRDGLYGDGEADFADNAWRFGLYCRAALEALRSDGRPVDVLHLHDWQAGPTAIFRAERYDDDPVVGPAALVTTLHNLAYHGWTANAALPQIGLRPGGAAAGQNADGVDLLAAAIEAAEIVNTVSPTYAREALTPEFGMGLDGLLRRREDRFVGILNGLDNTVWDPATDRDLAAPFSRGDLGGKGLCRGDLLERVGFDRGDDGPVIGMIGRLDPQKGFDLLADATPELVAAGARVIVQGSGHPSLADTFRSLAAASPDRVTLIERFDRVLARKIYAGADFFAMPSRFEPCGQGQMIALRYATPPIVHRTGGLADTVIDQTADPAQGTGFVFDRPTPTSLLEACERAFALRAAGGAAWDGLVDRGMALDFGWVTGAAPKYVEAYRRAVTVRREDRATR
ncbi:MAG TPA: glycogen/starch synthase [Methylomirabilota bacterium]|nr:glycogen/starch synthase [Methylomirabilota bacterium]